jgi:hypothetical protein
VQAFCLRHLRQGEDGPLETSPARELAEEFEDSLKIGRLPDQPWTLTPLGVAIEALPAPTTSSRAPGVPTVRIYNVHETRLRSPALIAAALANNAALSDEHLRQLAWEDRRRGGRGRANAVLALLLDTVVDAYRTAPIEERGNPLQFGGHLLDGNISVILPEVETRKYRWNHTDTNWLTGASF